MEDDSEGWLQHGDTGKGAALVSMDDRGVVGTQEGISYINVSGVSGVDKVSKVVKHKGCR